MHRQSIGLSTGTRHLHIGADEDDDKSRRRSKSLSVNVSIADIVGTEGEGRGDEEDDEKSSKPDRPFRYNTTEKSIHFIPLLTLLCFFVLYMFSHNPSPNGKRNRSSFFLRGDFFLSSSSRFFGGRRFGWNRGITDRDRIRWYNVIFSSFSFILSLFS